MRSKTNNIRRATQDLDIDFIKYFYKLPQSIYLLKK